jgi:hypothetical protein
MSSATARMLLGRLVDKAERVPDRILPAAERAPASFSSAEDRAAFTAVLRDAERASAIMLEWGRGETAHLIARLVLSDADQLRCFLGRTSVAARADEAIGAVEVAYNPRTAEGREAWAMVVEGWRTGKQPLRLSPSAPDEACRFLGAWMLLLPGSRWTVEI